MPLLMDQNHPGSLRCGKEKKQTGARPLPRNFCFSSQQPLTLIMSKVELLPPPLPPVRTDTFLVCVGRERRLMVVWKGTRKLEQIGDAHLVAEALTSDGRGSPDHHARSPIHAGSTHH